MRNALKTDIILNSDMISRYLDYPRLMKNHYNLLEIMPQQLFSEGIFVRRQKMKKPLKSKPLR